MTEPFFVRIRPRGAALWRRVEKPTCAVILPVVVPNLPRDLNAVVWDEVARNLPATPWFYVIFVANYFGRPFYETIIYHLLWKTGPQILPALLHKRVYNKAVLEYSGEAALIVWASKRTSITYRAAFRNVRDVNILSSRAANVVTFVVLAMVIGSVVGQFGVGDAALLRLGARITLDPAAIAGLFVAPSVLNLSANGVMYVISLLAARKTPALRVRGGPA